eukprot:TRINITY_DN9686_c0_g1_i6.p1 TRINITY_DN9686_c0_g1~~TRINITY_DN9686_c0_g1_i6.p1  ORF type:complete len:249 (+),score=15.71 TRINITY_DN9686_c0_g1_i6:347-1093(+)
MYPQPDTITIGQKEFLAIFNHFVEQYNQTRLDPDKFIAFEIATRLHRLLTSDRCREVHILIEGSDTLFRKYSYLNSTCLGAPTEKLTGNKAMSTAYPNEVLEEKLYIGHADHSRDRLVIETLRITHIVNATRDVDNYFEKEGKIKYLRVDVDDFDDSRIEHTFDDVYEFLETAFEITESAVLIHCKIGKSRSATLVIMYLMRKFRWTFQVAMDYVKEKREFVNPNPGFVSQLESFEKKLFEVPPQTSC